MNKKFIGISFFTVAFISAMITGCSNVESGSSGSSLFKKTDPESISFNWQESYENKINELKNSENFTDTSAFDIFDVTGDGKPELIFSPSTDATSKCTIYTYENDELKEIGEAGSNGTFSFCPETKNLKDEYAGNGFILGKIMKITNGSLYTIISYSDNSDSASLGAQIYHEIDGNDVSFSEYESALEEYSKNVYLDAGRRFTFGENTINYAVRYSESWPAVLSSEQKELCVTKLTEISDLSADKKNLAFDLCDLNGDKVPELIVSESPDEASGCAIYYFSDGNLIQMDGIYGAHGVLSFDTKSYVFFANGGSEKKYWSIANSGFSSSDYTESDSIAVIGRKYPINNNSILAVFN